MRLNQSGQLILPILAVLFLFGIFWIPYVLRCREMYWQLRMDAAADLAALSGAREKARLLNVMATMQTAQNLLVPQVKGRGLTGINAMAPFDASHRVLRVMEKGFTSVAYQCTRAVARLNGSTGVPRPLVGTSRDQNWTSRLEAQPLHVTYVISVVPPAAIQRYYPEGYFTRKWSSRTLNAQPDHVNEWQICRGSICGEGRAELWLDVRSESKVSNGGFPPKNTSLLRSIGFQCFYPQFNARLLPKR